MDIVVASEFMRDMVARSPLTAHVNRVHLIPFGVDAGLHLPEAERSRSREMLGIRRDDFVLLVRATEQSDKGLGHIISALKSDRRSAHTTVLTVDQKGLVRGLPDGYTVVDRGWVEDGVLLSRLYSAWDALLMPSAAEAFGLMGLEAMASERPVVSFEGTTLPWLTRAPECGLRWRWATRRPSEMPIDMLASNPEEARRRGHLGRRIAESDYGHETYLEALTSLYASSPRDSIVITARLTITETETRLRLKRR